MEQHLAALRAGQISFDQFALKTARDWDRLAGKVYSVWRLKIPLGVAVEDVRQEMLFHAWRAVGQWSPAGGMSLKGYVVFIACSKAARFLHAQRCALRRDGKAPSRHPNAFSQLLKHNDDTGEDWIDALLTCEDDPCELIDAARTFERALDRAYGVDLYVVLALKQTFGDIPRAAKVLFNEHLLGVAQGWGNEGDAARQIEKTLCTLCA